MGEALDRFSKALASGTSRRSALAGLLAGSAAVLPWTAEAKKKKNKRKKKFKKFQTFCNQWCGDRFELDEKARKTCVEKAKEGKGACYSSVEEGPAFYCINIAGCGERNCCPTLVGGEPVKDALCCETPCDFSINGTFICS